MRKRQNNVQDGGGIVISYWFLVISLPRASPFI